MRIRDVIPFHLFDVFGIWNRHSTFFRATRKASAKIGFDIDDMLQDLEHQDGVERSIRETGSRESTSRLEFRSPPPFASSRS